VRAIAAAALAVLAAAPAARAGEEGAGPADERGAPADEGEYQGEDVAFDARPPEPKAPAAPAGPLPERRLSLTVSAFHLILPVAHVVAELKLRPRLGVGAVVGAGRVAVGTGRDQYPIYEIGAQASYYVRGTFDRGWQAGAELVYAIVDADAGRPTGIGRGLGAGLFAGWKWTFRRGLTVNIQAGALFFIADQDDSGLEPLLNLGAGWSF
jgi:hypothetical protein